MIVSGEPTSLNPTNSQSYLENYVVASGNKNWNDVTDDWTFNINGFNEPAGFICERGIIILLI